jgi:hypothetical protein
MNIVLSTNGQNTALSLNPNKAKQFSLLEITDDCFIYKINYRINPVITNKKNCWSVSISLKKTSPLISIPTNNFLGTIVSISSTKKQASKTKQENDTVIKISDFTKSIPNDVAALLKNPSYIFNRETEDKIVQNSIFDVSTTNGFIHEFGKTLLSKGIYPLNDKEYLLRISQNIPETVLIESTNVVDYVEVSENLKISKSLIKGNEFVLCLNLIENGTGLIKETKEIVVQHSKILGEFNLKKSEPTFVVAKNDSTNFIYVQGNTKLYKRILPKNEYVSLGAFETTTKIIDHYNPGLTIIYYSTNGEIYNSQVSIPLCNSYKFNQYKKPTLICSYGNSQIDINILNIPTIVKTIKLFKTTFSPDEREEIQLINVFNKHELTTKDIDVKKNSQYFYDIELFDVYSNKLDTVFIDNTVSTKELKNNLVSTTIVNLEQKEDNVTFEIKSTFIETDENKIKTALEAQGLFSLLSSDLSLENLQNLLAYRIVRQNITDGLEEEFGTTVSKFFSDVEIGPLNNVEPIVTGKTYKYIIETYLRSLDSVFKDKTINVVFDNSSKNYSYKPAYSKHPITLSEGNIVSDVSLKANYANNVFSFGTLVQRVETAEIKTGVSNAAFITELQKNQLNDKTILITWKSSDSKQLEAFLLFANKNFVGKIHCIDDNNNHQFLHTNISNDTIYTVIPVYHDFHLGNGNRV